MAFSTPDTHISGYIVLASDWNEHVNNFLAINNFYRQELWPDKEALAPYSGITPAGMSIVESSDGGTNKPLIPILTFAGDADYGRQWQCRWPRGYGVSAVLVGSYYMTGVNSDDEAVLEGSVAALSDGDLNATAKAYDTLNQLIHTVPDAVGTSDEFSIPLANEDGVVANDWVNILLMRNGDDGSDTANVGGLALKTLAVDFSLAT